MILASSFSFSSTRGWTLTIVIPNLFAGADLEEELRELQASVVRREVERTEPSAPVLLPDDILQQILLRVLLGTYFVYELHLLSFREIGVTF